MTPGDPLTALKGVGEAQAGKFALLGVKTIDNLLHYYPRRYEDYSELTTTKSLIPGKVTIKARINNIENRYVRRGMVITEAIASDEYGSVRLIWFNQAYRKEALKRGQEYFISGNYELSHQKFSIMSPGTELVSEFPINTARIVPVYSTTSGLTSREIRRAMRQALLIIRELPETLPQWLITDYKLMGRAAAVEAIHFPANTNRLDHAKRRLGFEELFELGIASLLNKLDNESETAIAVAYDRELDNTFQKSLHFTLTDPQAKAAVQIFADMQKPHPMNRMLEGDVGSGKTVVATMAALMTLTQRGQVAFMAPTELLARQHAETISKLLKPLHMEDKITLLTGSMKPEAKANAHQAIATGKAQLIIGTHALIQEKVDFHHLLLVIIDEQHRFGVEQRKTLMAKAGHMPHMLSLTATPIPRSLAFVMFGELDSSIIDTKPANRVPVITEIVSPNSRAQLYRKIDTELETGRQMFVVCPLITESTAVEANSVEKMYESLSKGAFKNRRVGLLHGKMKTADKNEVMEKFVNHELDILVSTTVVEVGIDVPNATVMLIESADRFGLAQLHQLRGRVGRSEHQGHCYLMMSDSSAPNQRLRAVERSDNGFELAELDLELRGPGAFKVGTEQHGYDSNLKIADLTNKKMLQHIPKIAQDFLAKEKLKNYPILAKKVKTLREIVYMD
jgi:ATP-dependent DNA helicase RecG